MVGRMCIINCTTVNGGVLTGTGLEGLTESFQSFRMVNLRGNSKVGHTSHKAGMQSRTFRGLFLPYQMHYPLAI